MREDPGPSLDAAAPGAGSAPPATGPAGGASAPSARDAAMDALRMLAVLLMVASHTSRLVAWDERRAWSRWSLVVEPLTASLFLILVGASLVQSREKARRNGVAPAAWLRRQALRAAALWAVSIAFYTVSEGFHFPDAVFLSGILCTIAYTILGVGLLLASPRPLPAVGAASAVLAVAYVWLDLRGMRYFALSAGNSPLLPLSLFGYVGALGAMLLRLRGRGAALLAAVAVAAAAAVLAYLVSRYGFVGIFTKPIGRYETARVFLSGPEGARVEKSIPYYNLRAILSPVILASTVLLYALLAASRPLLDRASGPLLRLGRRSLDVYVLHLAVLAALVAAGGKRPLKEAWQGDAVYLGVLALCYAWVWGRDVLAARSRLSAAAGRAARRPSP